MWLYNLENLSEQKRAEFEQLKGAQLKTARAWAIREQFRWFWDCRSAEEADEFFQAWFRHRSSNAAAEGFNSIMSVPEIRHPRVAQLRQLRNRNPLLLRQTETPPGISEPLNCGKNPSSVIGTWLAAIVGMLVGTNWRYAYLIGILPAILVLWVRVGLREPDRWASQQQSLGRAAMGRFRDVWQAPLWRYRALLGILLASVGLGTFWAVGVAGQTLAEDLLIRQGTDRPDAIRAGQFAYGIVQTAGGGLGLLSFGPICARLGRRTTFILYPALAFVIVPVTCFAPQSYYQMLFLLPAFGFLTLGIHAGYAIYFPELFPTHIRATATSLCFNGGRMLAVPVLILSGWLKGIPGADLRWTVSGLSLLFLLGILIVWWMPETRGQELPE